MKKLFLLVLGCLFVFFTSNLALATPFQIDGSSLDVDWDWGGGIVVYTPNTQAVPEDLEVGESYDFTFGNIFVPASLGQGTATLGVNFSTPEPNGAVEDEGEFFALSFVFFSVGGIEFGNPEEFEYSYLGATGGVFSLDLHDITGIQLGTCVQLTGTITNVGDPQAPVPEPATMVLFGIGLLGLAGVSRRKNS